MKGLIAAEFPFPRPAGIQLPGRTRVAGPSQGARGEGPFLPGRPGALGGCGFLSKDPGNLIPDPQSPLAGAGAGIPSLEIPSSG